MARTDQLPKEAFKAACAEQRKIAALLARLEEKRLDLAEQAYANQRNWAIVGDLTRIREQLEELLGDRG